MVKTIAVRDGQVVQAGELLVELDGTATRADLERLRREWWEAQADVARGQALLAGTRVFLADTAAETPPPGVGDMPEDIRRSPSRPCSKAGRTNNAPGWAR